MKKDPILFLTVIALSLTSFLILGSLGIFSLPLYIVYFLVALGSFWFFSRINFGTLTFLSPQLYVACGLFLLTPLIIGQVTRGTVRWIPIGNLTIQPAELVRPFLFIFFANFFTSQGLTVRRLGLSVLLMIVPLFLIYAQPSLGVAIVTFVGIMGTLLSSGINKRHLLIALILMLLSLPIFWSVLQPYQRSRVMTFLSPWEDPSGAGYNSIQAMISVGSGGPWGRGLGKGVQTQLAFLPEKHTDFIFASLAEELGFLGAGIVVLAEILLLYRLIVIAENAVSPIGRAFIGGVFLSLFTQTFVHIGMNLGIFPITGIPLPLVSAGGSSLVATMMMLGIALAVKKKSVI